MSKFSKEDFINKAREKHGNKYDYSEALYVTSKKYLKIICPIHGPFIQRANHHLEGSGCPLCARAKRCISKEEFLQKANKIHHNKYNYSKVRYKNYKSPVTITCPIHGDFTQTPISHVTLQQGCPKCGRDKCSFKFRKSTKKFIQEAQLIHGIIYDYSKTKYKSNKENVTITCPIHGDFIQKPQVHLRGSGCPSCTGSSSEKIIAAYLKQHNISFIQQYRFKLCKSRQPLPFDFALLNKKGEVCCLLEYQGKQHFKSIAFWGGKRGLLKQKKHDSIKLKFCKQEKIPLLYITYTEDIINKLNNYLSVFKKLTII